MSVRVRWRGVAFSLPLLLAACGGDALPPRSFPALSYTYLTPLHLNVVSLDIQDHSAPAGPDDVAALSPVTPQQALTTMAHDRLFPGGPSGQAVFVIDNAVINRADGTLDGSLSVHLDIIGPGGSKLGYAEAHVSRHHAPSDSQEDRPTALYDLTKQMMADMNVEFEYQVRQSLGAFLQSDTAVPAPVVAQPLTGAPLPSPAAPGTALPSYPPAYPPTNGSVTTDPRALSPPPSYLQPPGLANPASGAAADPTIAPDSAPPSSGPVYQPPATPTPNPNGPIQLAPTD